MVGVSRLVRAALVALVVGFLPRVAAGMVSQPPPGNEVMPLATGENEVAIVRARGFPDDAVRLAGVFKYFAGGADSAIDPVRDAQLTPGTFSPTCGLTVALVLNGGGCRNALGWYNATEPATLPPAIFAFVPTDADLRAAPPDGLSCMDGDFCPLATRTTTQVGTHTWVDPLYAFDPAIRTDPRWNGGKVGLALIGRTASQCPQTKYSQADLNEKSPSGAPWVSALIYQSVAEPSAHYLAFESMPTCTQSWRGCNGVVVSDGDFNDAVFYVRENACPFDGGAPGGAGGAGAGGGAAGMGGGAGGIGGGGGTGGNGGAGGAAGSANTGGSAGTAGSAATGGASGTIGGPGGAAGSDGAAGSSGAAGASGATGSSGASGVGGVGGGAGAGGGAKAGAGGATVGGAGGSGSSQSGGGCGCRIASERSGAWPLLLALLLLHRRRRRPLG